jgi:uncharacterized protein YndB with AHSA1/START domain
MTTQTAQSSVTKSIAVDAPIERAFAVFTEGMQDWWPSEHHILQAKLEEMVFETRVGGHIYDTGVDGSECHWSRVLAYESPTRVVFSWDITPEFTIETDLARTSEVEVLVIAESPRRTRVELTHRHLDRHGDGWERLRDAVASPEGWGEGLERFAGAARTT